MYDVCGKCGADSLSRSRSGADRNDPSEPRHAQLCYGNATSKGDTNMNRNVTIGLGTLIVIIIIVALLF